MTTSTGDRDRGFDGSIPALYDRWLVPLIFEPYADDLAGRVAALRPSSVLEIAAGTGVVTRRLARLLDAGVAIVATDLNRAMIDHAAALGTARPVEWRTADAMALPFADESFDVVVSQFGVMFFADKARAFAEVRRVLRRGGTLLFNVWDAIEHNEFADVVTQALAERCPASPPTFLARTPHGYHERARIEADLRHGGFQREAAMETIAARSRADAPWLPARAYCEGTPLRNEIEALGSIPIALASEHAAAAIARRFGPGPVDGAIRAHVVSVDR